MKEISEISVQSLGETFEVADAMARKFGVNTVYPIDINKRGSGNNILYITVPGVESYDDMDGKSVALNTGIYCVQWTKPQTVYININGLGNKALYRPLPTNHSADYDNRQYNTAKYVDGEISRHQTLIVSFRKDDSGVTATLINPASAPRATKEIAEDSRDDVSYVTPKSVATAMRGTLKNPIEIDEIKLNTIYTPGFYLCNFDITVYDGDEEHVIKEKCIVEVRTYSRDEEDVGGEIYNIAVQRAFKGNIKSLSLSEYNSVAWGEGEYERHAVVGHDYSEWTRIGTGTWTNPFIVSDPKTDLSTLTTPGIYYFDFGESSNVHIDAVDVNTSLPYYINHCFMLTVTGSGDFSGTAIYQKIWGFYEETIRECSRTITTEEQEQDWRCMTDDTFLKEIYDRLDALEASLGG